MAAKKKAATHKKRASAKSLQTYVLCHQKKAEHGITKTPYEAKLIQEGHYHCQVEYKRKRFWVNRGACSTVPYTK